VASARDVLTALGLTNDPGAVSVSPGYAPYTGAPETAGSPQSFPVSAGQDLDQPLSFIPGSVVIDNNTDSYLEVVDAMTDGGSRWLSAGQGGSFPLFTSSPRARLKWTAPPGKIQSPPTAGQVAQATFWPIGAPAGLGFAAPSVSISVRDIATLSGGNLANGFNSTDGPFSDLYIMGWNLWIANGAAAAQVSVAVKGDQSNLIVPFGDMMALANGISSGPLTLPMPIRVASILPNDTTYHCGIRSEAAYTLNRRGQIYLGQ
jgi:hypothetical protein